MNSFCIQISVSQDVRDKLEKEGIDLSYQAEAARKLA